MHNFRLAFTSENVVRFISPDEIMYCISVNNSTEIIISSGKKIATSKTLKELEIIFNITNFVRIHKSSLVNITFVLSFKTGKVNKLEMQDGIHLSVSRSKKSELLANLVS